MKRTFFKLNIFLRASSLPVSFLAALLCLAFAPQAAQPPACAAPGLTNVATFGTNMDFKVPQAAFLMPHNPQEGKDPFFPRSSRPYISGQPVSTNVAPVVVVLDFHLRGISGTAEHRLAIINNHTFEAGEEAEVTTSTGRSRVRCLEIHADSVIIQAGPERRELRMRGGL